MKYQKKYRQIRQEKGEANKMVKAGFPKCFSLRVGKISEHCNTCIKMYRKRLLTNLSTNIDKEYRYEI